MTERQSIRVGSIVLSFIEAINGAIETDERLRLAVEGMVRDEKDLSSFIFAVGTSFPLLVYSSITGKQLDSLSFNHQMNSLCFQMVDFIPDAEKMDELLSEFKDDEIRSSIDMRMQEQSLKFNELFSKIITNERSKQSLSQAEKN